jgi:hypothetical protein
MLIIWKRVTGSRNNWTPKVFNEQQSEEALAFVETLEPSEYMITAPAAIECMIVYGSTTEVPQVEAV